MLFKKKSLWLGCGLYDESGLELEGRGQGWLRMVWFFQFFCILSLNFKICLTFWV